MCDIYLGGCSILTNLLQAGKTFEVHNLLLDIYTERGVCIYFSCCIYLPPANQQGETMSQSEITSENTVLPLFDRALKRLQYFMMSTYAVTKSTRALIPTYADSDKSMHQCWRIRHEVFAAELGLEPVNKQRLEQCETDAYSRHCLMKMKKSNRSCATVRLVTPTLPDEKLPIQKFCSSSITDQKYHPDQFHFGDICEASRLAIAPEFRRRKSDFSLTAGTGNFKAGYQVANKRDYPIISMSLFIAAGALFILSGRKHGYVMVEPSLARKMSFVGLRFKQIGPVVDYHGQRAPYYMSRGMFLHDLKWPFRIVFNYYLHVLKQKA